MHRQGWEMGEWKVRRIQLTETVMHVGQYGIGSKWRSHLKRQMLSTNLTSITRVSKWTVTHVTIEEIRTLTMMHAAKYTPSHFLSL